MNFTTGVTLANTVITKLLRHGHRVPYSNVTTSVVIDVSGSLTSEAFAALPAPKRIVDSRNPAWDTDDEQQERFGALPGGTTRAIPVAGRVGLAGDVKQRRPHRRRRRPRRQRVLHPLPLRHNPTPGVEHELHQGRHPRQHRRHQALRPPGTECVYSNVTTDVVIDVSGSLTPAAFAALPSPQRIVDSRNPAGDTDDEQQERFGPLTGGTTRTIPVAGRVGLAGDVETSSSPSPPSHRGPTGSSPSTPAAPPSPSPPA